MKKLFVSALCIVALTLYICTGCTQNGVIPQKIKNYPIPPKPETELEFWLAEDVASVDFSEYTEIRGWMGARQYYGKGYQPIENPEADTYHDRYKDPEHYVKYLVTAYPDHADGGEYITDIEITDPNINVYGITCDSSFEQFSAIMINRGYKISKFTGTDTKYEKRTASLGKVTFEFSTYNETHHKLRIFVEITNRDGIEY